MKRLKTILLQIKEVFNIFNGLSEHIKEKYKIVWEIPMRSI